MTDYILLIIFLIMVAALLVFWLSLRVFSAKNIAPMPIAHNLIEEQRQTKKRNLELILGLFATYNQLTNAIVRKELGFDDRVIVDYFDVLEKTGQVRQMGKTGVDSHYILAK